MDNLRKLLNTDSGLVLRKFLIRELSELKNIDNTNESIEDLIGQKKAYKCVKGILDKVIDFNEEEIDKELNEYGIL